LLLIVVVLILLCLLPKELNLAKLKSAFDLVLTFEHSLFNALAALAIHFDIGAEVAEWKYPV
jgi:UDP-N-acetylmuramyl pentapeptide synthase